MPPASSANFQTYFHRRWQHLDDPHVRSLAWLLDAPDLLDPAAPQWHGKVATLGPISSSTEEWLTALDKTPESLHAWLGPKLPRRLGLYAERLMGFYLREHGMLAAHNVQVRDASGTIGEFDFLVHQGDEFVHWEFASKFYLLHAGLGLESADQFLGPNLADTLGLKVRKIMEKQLNLSRHPAARAVLPQPVTYAQALVKGWLFYHGMTPPTIGKQGISMAHCRGFWRPVGEVDAMAGTRFVILPRLQWLAPIKIKGESCLDKTQLLDHLHQHFANDLTPVLVSVLEEGESTWLEADRGFIVPNDWEERAENRAGQP